MRIYRSAMAGEAARQAMAEQATRDRTETFTRLSEMINAVGDAAFNALNVYQLQVKHERFKNTFALLEQHNRVAVNYAADEQARRALWTAFYGLDERHQDALASCNQRMAELEAQAAAQAAVVAAANAPPPGAGAAALQPAQPPVIQVNMTPVDLGISFNGDPLEWFDFKDRFKLAVHDEVNMAPTLKLTHLRNAMKGPAAEAMKGFRLNADNYMEHWNELVKKYERKYSIACTHLSRFYALKKLGTRPAALDLQNMVNQTNQLMRQIRDLEYNVENWDLLIVHALQERLSCELAGRWEVERKGNDNPTIAGIVKFLEDQATSITNQGLAYPSMHVTIHNERANQHNAGPSNRPPIGATPQKYPCGYCDRPDHLIYVCPEFIPLSLDQRKQGVNLRKLCHNCLRRNHYKDACTDPHRCGLPQCAKDNRHNSLLCPFKVRQPDFAAMAHSPSRVEPREHEGFDSRGLGRGQPWKRRYDNNQS